MLRRKGQCEEEWESLDGVLNEAGQMNGDPRAEQATLWQSHAGSWVYL